MGTCKRDFCERIEASSFNVIIRQPHYLKTITSIEGIKIKEQPTGEPELVVKTIFKEMLHHIDDEMDGEEKFSWYKVVEQPRYNDEETQGRGRK